MQIASNIFVGFKENWQTKNPKRKSFRYSKANGDEDEIKTQMKPASWEAPFYISLIFGAYKNNNDTIQCTNLIAAWKHQRTNNTGILPGYGDEIKSQNRKLWHST